MPAPASNDELFALILKSGVMDDARLNGYLDRLRAAGQLSDDPIKLGETMVGDGLLTHFQAEQLLQGRWKRFSIGKYKVLERLGVGGMGQVFLCEHKLMKRKVAVKVLPAAKAKDEAALQRFYREARAVAAVDHPNIARAYDIDDDNDLHFLVMEYVDGANLYDIVRKSGPLPPLRACHYVYGTAVGLQHAHEMGLVHRDIKPANILVDRTGTVKLLDMGLARFFNPDDDDHLTKKFDENVLGTADYLAPEQAVDSTKVDIRADIYGLGGTFYFLLTGLPPFPDGTIAQKLLWHQTKPPRPISDHRSDVPPQLAAVVDKMLAKEPGDRYQTPAEIMAALAGWVQTPIPPPTEDELPRMSVAAGGRPPGSSPVVAASQPVPAPPPRPLPTPRPAPLSPPMATPLATPMPAALPPVKPVAAVVTPAAASGETANVWADLRNSETIPTAEDTTPTRRRDRKRDDDGEKERKRGRNRDDEQDDPPAKTPSPRSARRRRTEEADDDTDGRRGGKGKAAAKKSPLLLIVLAAVGGLVLVGGGGTAAVFLFGGKPTPTSSAATSTNTAGPKVWYVSKSGDGPNPATTRKTVGELLPQVKAGDELIVLDDSVDVPDVVIPVKNVRIAAADPAKPVRWVYKPSAGKRTPAAVIDVRGADGVTLSGLVIEVDGQLDVGVRVSGSATGVKLENVTVRGAKKQAVLVQNVTADPAHPLTLGGCRFVLPAGAESGVSLVAGPSLDTRGVRVEGCRFESTGAGSGVRIEGAAADVVVRNNRLFNLDSGVLVAGEAGKVFKLTVERNTVHTAKVGVKIDQPPAPDRAVSVTGNYFAGGGIAATAADPKGVTFAGNGRDAGTQEGASGAAVAEGSVAAPKPDAPDDQFLRGKVTAGGKPVGAE